jgi:hypothetical protein
MDNMNGDTPKAPLKIIEVTYGKTINIGDYESVRIDLKAAVGPDEDWREVLQRLRVTVTKLDPRIRQDRC